MNYLNLFIAVAVVLLSISLHGNAAGIPPNKCQPTWGTSNSTCTRLIQQCWNDWMIKMKWTDTGTKGHGRSRMHDAGCQCDQYCGFKTANACNKDPQCTWKKTRNSGACYNKLSGKKGESMNYICPTSSNVLEAVDISVVRNTTCAITLNGSAKCWGEGWSGTLGNSANLDSNIPVQVTGLTSGVTSICAGSQHACAVHRGAVKCWGNNDDGQLGDGTLFQSNSPVQVIGLTSKVSQVFCGWYHSCAILVNKKVKCWGSNGEGQLGDNTTIDRNMSVPVLLLSNVDSLALGIWDSCATTQGSTQTWCWGFKTFDQFGMGTDVDGNFLVPTRMVNQFAGGRLSSLTAGAYTTCAINGTGTALCVGGDQYGQIGDGQFDGTPRHVPVVPSGLESNVVSISASLFHTCVVLRSGSCLCTGSDMAGIFGDNTKEAFAVQVPVVGDQDYVKVATGKDHTCAIHRNHSVSCWGYNDVGQLGNGVFAPTPQITGPVIVWPGN